VVTLVTAPAGGFHRPPASNPGRFFTLRHGFRIPFM